MKIGGDSLQTSTWSQLIQVLVVCASRAIFLLLALGAVWYWLICPSDQLNFIKHFLGGGFVKYMQVCIAFSSSVAFSSGLNRTFKWYFLLQENDFLHEVFGFVPKKKYLVGGEHQMSSGEKVCCFNIFNLHEVKAWRRMWLLPFSLTVSIPV